MEELRKRQKIISQLVEARLEQGISQAELARRLGIQRSGINRLESGTQNPTLDMISVSYTHLGNLGQSKKELIARPGHGNTAWHGTPRR